MSKERPLNQFEQTVWASVYASAFVAEAVSTERSQHQTIGVLCDNPLYREIFSETASRIADQAVRTLRDTEPEAKPPLLTATHR